jgi:hypothetical protein
VLDFLAVVGVAVHTDGHLDLMLLGSAVQRMIAGMAKVVEVEVRIWQTALQMVVEQSCWLVELIEPVEGLAYMVHQLVVDQMIVEVDFAASCNLLVVVAADGMVSPLRVLRRHRDLFLLRHLVEEESFRGEQLVQGQPGQQDYTELGQIVVEELEFELQVVVVLVVALLVEQAV